MMSHTAGYVLAPESAERLCEAWGYCADDERACIWDTARKANKVRLFCTAEPDRWHVFAVQELSA